MAKEKTVKFLVNVGTIDQRAHAIPNRPESNEPPREGDVMDLEEGLANKLVDSLKLAVHYDAAMQKADTERAERAHKDRVASLVPAAERELALEAAKVEAKELAKNPPKTKAHPVSTETPEDSQLSQESEDAAISTIATWKNKDKLQQVINTDKRHTVVDAARKRLAVL